MGLLDSFTSDGTTEMKYTEYYKLMREAAKAELMENSIRCNTPHGYIREMLTGKMEAPEILPEVEADPDYEMENIFTSVRRFFRTQSDEDRLLNDVETFVRIISLAGMERLNEIEINSKKAAKIKDIAIEAGVLDKEEASSEKPKDLTGLSNLSRYLVSMIGTEGADKILNMTPQEKKTKFIMVAGKEGPTGKTTLKQILRDYGYQALEPFECIEIELSEELPHPIPDFINLLREDLRRGEG